MKELKIQYERAAELVFKICYLILAFATFNPFIYASKVQPLFVKLTLVSGMLLMIIRLVKYKKYKKMPGLILMILFCLSFALSTFMNRQYGMIENGKWIIWTALQFFALYVCDVDRETKDYLKEFQIVSHIMIIYSMIASVISLKMLITSFSKIWQTVDGEFLVSGFIWGRLWGCYTDPNYGGAFAVVAIILSLVFFIKKKNLWRIVYVCSIVVNFLYLIFSDSRTGEIALACSLSIFLYFYLNRKLKDKKSVVRCGMIVMAILVINAGALVGIRVAKTEYNRQLAPVFAKMFSPKPMENTQKKQQVQQNVGRQQDIEKDVSNGRFALWGSAVDVWKTSPIYGAGYTTFIPYAKEHVPDTYAVNNEGGDYMSMHNAFMNTLAFQGTIGFVLLLLIAGYLVWYVFMPVFREESEEYLYLVGMLSCLGAVVVAMMFLLEGTYTISLGSFVLWVFSGYLVQFAYRKRKEEK